MFTILEMEQFSINMLVDYSVEKVHSWGKIIKLILVCNPGLVNEYSKIDGISNSPAEALIIFSWNASVRVKLVQTPGNLQEIPNAPTTVLYHNFSNYFEIDR